MSSPTGDPRRGSCMRRSPQGAACCRRYARSLIFLPTPARRKGNRASHPRDDQISLPPNVAYTRRRGSFIGSKHDSEIRPLSCATCDYQERSLRYGDDTTTPIGHTHRPDTNPRPRTLLSGRRHPTGRHKQWPDSRSWFNIETGSPHRGRPSPKNRSPNATDRRSTMTSSGSIGGAAAASSAAGRHLEPNIPAAVHQAF